MSAVVLSHSSLEDYLRCKRIYAFRKIDGVPKASNAKALVGNATHEDLEGWSAFGKQPDHTRVMIVEDRQGNKHPHYPGRYAEKIIPNIPPPKTPGVRTERQFFLETCDDDGTPVAIWTGRIDLSWDNVVWDHKTTGDFKWMKTVEELRKNSQALLYAAATFSEQPDLDVVQCYWGYVLTKKPFTFRRVDLELSRAEAEAGIDELNKHARDIIALHETAERTQKRTLELLTDVAAGDYNPKACEQYGGCTFRDTCNLPTEAKMVAYMARDIMAEMRAKAAAKAAGTKPAAAAPKAAAAPPPKVGGLMAARAAKMAGAKLNPPAEEVEDIEVEETPEEEAPAAAPARRGRPPKASTVGSAGNAADLVATPLRSVNEAAKLLAIEGLCAGVDLSTLDPERLDEIGDVIAFVAGKVADAAFPVTE